MNLSFDLLVFGLVVNSLFFFSFQGMETMIVRYNSIVTSVKKKGYDLLDHRKGEVLSEILSYSDKYNTVFQNLFRAYRKRNF